jgi:hypothetical protein
MGLTAVVVLSPSEPGQAVAIVRQELAPLDLKKRLAPLDLKKRLAPLLGASFLV